MEVGWATGAEPVEPTVRVAVRVESTVEFARVGEGRIGVSVGTTRTGTHAQSDASTAMPSSESMYRNIWLIVSRPASACHTFPHSIPRSLRCGKLHEKTSFRRYLICQARHSVLYCLLQLVAIRNTGECRIIPKSRMACAKRGTG